jgi:hypothetical protein
LSEEFRFVYGQKPCRKIIAKYPLKFPCFLRLTDFYRWKFRIGAENFTVNSPPKGGAAEIRSPEKSGREFSRFDGQINI